MLQIGYSKLKIYLVLTLLVVSPIMAYQTGGTGQDPTTTSYETVSLSGEDNTAVGVDVIEDDMGTQRSVGDPSIYTNDFSSRLPTIKSTSPFYTQFENGIQQQGKDEYLELDEATPGLSGIFHSYAKAVVKVNDNKVLMVMKVSQASLPGDLVELLLSNGATVDRFYPKLSAYTIYIPLSQLKYNHDGFIKELLSNPVVSYIQPSVHYTLQDFVPNDPYWPDLWGMQRIDMPLAYGLQVEANVIVAVIDTGIDYNHEDLVGRYIGGYDYYYDDANPMDGHGHGTHVSGTITGQINNGIGVAGVGNFSILAYKIFGDGGGYAGDVDAADALISGVDAGAKVLSNSWGGGPNSQIINDAIDYAIANNVLPVFAAGNSASDYPHYPGAYEPALAVGATNINDELAWFSNYGDWVDLVAPGEYIWSSLPGNTYAPWDGTSMATPHVSGVAAMLYAAYPEMSVDEIQDLILESVVDLGAPGFDPVFGHGLLNAYNAILGPPDHDLKATITGDRLISIGDNGSIEVGITNRGIFNETNIHATLYENDIPIRTVVLESLSSGESYTETIDIHPTDLGVISYVLTVDPVPDEQRLDNNEAFFAVTVSDLSNYMEYYPQFEWLDAASNGYLLLDYCDDCVGQVDIPFDFPFYDQYFSTFYVSSNGWLSFTNSYPYQYWNQPFPLEDSYFWYMIAGLWDDLYLDQGKVYAWVTDTFVVIEFNNVDYLWGEFLGSFQIVLYADGTIYINFQQVEYYLEGTTGLNYGVDPLFYNQFTGMTTPLYEFTVAYTTNLDPYIDFQPDVTARDLNFNGVDDTLYTTFRSTWYQEAPVPVEAVFEYYWYNPSTLTYDYLDNITHQWTADGRGSEVFEVPYYVPRAGDYRVNATLFVDGIEQSTVGYDFSGMEVIYENLVLDVVIESYDIDGDGIDEGADIFSSLNFFVENLTLLDLITDIYIRNGSGGEWILWDTVESGGSFFYESGSIVNYYNIEVVDATEFMVITTVIMNGAVFEEWVDYLDLDGLDETFAWWYASFLSDRDGDTQNDTINVEFELYWNVFTYHYLEFLLNVSYWDSTTDEWVRVDDIYLYGEIMGEYTFHSIYDYTAITEGTYRIDITVLYDHEINGSASFEEYLYASSEYIVASYDVVSYDGNEDNLTDTVDISVFIDYNVSDFDWVELGVDILRWNENDGYWEYVDGFFDYYEFEGEGNFTSMFHFTARQEGQYRLVIFVYSSSNEVLFDEYNLYLYAGDGALYWNTETWTYDQDGDGLDDYLEYILWIDFLGGEYTYFEAYVDLYYIDPDTGEWHYMQGFYHYDEFNSETSYGIGQGFRAFQEGEYVVTYEVYVNFGWDGYVEEYVYLYVTGDYVNLWVDLFPEDRDNNYVFDRFSLYYGIEAFVAEEVYMEFLVNVSMWDESAGEWILVEEVYRDYSLLGESYVYDYYQFFAAQEGMYLMQVNVFQDGGLIYFDDLMETLEIPPEYVFFDSYSFTFDRDNDGFDDSAFLEWYTEYYQNNETVIEIVLDIYYLNGSEYEWIDGLTVEYNVTGEGYSWDYTEYRALFTAQYLFEISYFVNAESYGNDSYFYMLYEATGDSFEFYNEVDTYDRDGDGLEDSAEVVGWIEYSFSEVHIVEMFISVFFVDNATGDWILIGETYSGEMEVIGEGGIGIGFDIVALMEGEYIAVFDFYLDYDYQEVQEHSFYLYEIGEFAMGDIWVWAVDSDGEGSDDTIWMNGWYEVLSHDLVDVTLLFEMSWFNETLGDFEFVDAFEQTTQVIGYQNGGYDFSYVVETAGRYQVSGSLLVDGAVIVNDTFDFYNMEPIQPFLFWNITAFSYDQDGDMVTDSALVSAVFSFYVVEPILFELYVQTMYFDGSTWIQVGDYASGFYAYGLWIERAFLRDLFTAPFEGEFVMNYYLLMDGELVDWGEYYTEYLVPQFGSTGEVWTSTNIPFTYLDNDFDGVIDTITLDFFVTSTEPIMQQMWWDVFLYNEETGEYEFIETIYEEFEILPGYINQDRINFYYPFEGSYELFFSWVVDDDVLFESLPFHEIFPYTGYSTGLHKDYGPFMYGLDFYYGLEEPVEVSVSIFDFFSAYYEVYIDGISFAMAEMPVNFGEGAYNASFVLDLPAGLHDVEIVAYDIFGNANTFHFQVYIQDSTPPEITGPEETTFEETVFDMVLSWVVQDDNLGYYEVYINAELFLADYVNDTTSISIDINFAGYAAGEYNISINAMDMFGNSASFVAYVLITPDITAPTVVTDEYPYFNHRNTDNALEFDLYDSNPGSYVLSLHDEVIDSGSWTNGLVSIPLARLHVSCYVFEFVATDLLGNEQVVLIYVSIVPTDDDWSDRDVPFNCQSEKAQKRMNAVDQATPVFTGFELSNNLMADSTVMKPYKKFEDLIYQ